MEHSGTCEGYDDTAAVAEVEMVAVVHPRLLVVESHLSSPRFFLVPLSLVVTGTREVHPDMWHDRFLFCQSASQICSALAPWH